MDDHDIEHARLIAMNIGDIQEMMERLIEEVETLRRVKYPDDQESGQKAEQQFAEFRNLLEGSARQFRLYAGQHMAKGSDTLRSETDRDEHRAKAEINAGMARTIEDALAGNTYHQLAMRTAAGPEVFHYPTAYPLQNTMNEDFVASMVAYLIAADRLDRWKSRLFYGKDKPERDPTEFAALRARSAALDFIPNPQLIHAILGIASEGAELVEDLLKLLSEECPASEREAVVQNIVRETGDVDWFQELLAHALGVPVTQSRGENIARLRRRFPGKYSEEDALARMDENTDPFVIGEADVGSLSVELGTPGVPSEDDVDRIL